MRTQSGIKLGTLPLKTLAARGALKDLLERFDWIYLGAEFCENLMQPPETVLRGVRFFLNRGKKVCLLTPPLTETGLKRLGRTLSLLAKLKRTEGRLEVTINDFGAAQLAGEMRLPLELNAGRLLYENVFKVRKKALSVINRYALAFFTSRDISRFEISTTGSPLKTNFARAAGFGFDPEDLRLTMYYPYLNISSTRNCLLGTPRIQPHEAVLGIHCRRECGSASFRLKHPSVKEALVVRGNTVFLCFPRKFYSSSESLSAMRIDRLVYCPFP